MVWEAEVAEFESKANEVDEEVRGVNATIDENGAVDVGMGKGGEG